MKKMALSLLITLISCTSFAEEHLAVTVKGMVCSFCSTGVEKTFSKRKEVKSVSVDMEKKLVSIILKDNSTLEDKLVTKLITDSGFNVAKIDRSKVTKGPVKK